MGMEAAALPVVSAGTFEQLRTARQVLLRESEALAELANRLGEEFCRAVELLQNCRGKVVVAGMGKAGLIGRKIAATLASTGTPSHFLHPAEALHGDLGCIRQGDVALLLSQSGQTQEILRLLPCLAELGTPIIAITGCATSSLGRAATVTLEIGPLQEADPLGLAPTTSTTAMLALGDALAIVAAQLRNFGREDFARFHPGGTLGQRLAKVEEAMRPLEQCRLAHEGLSVREVLVSTRLPGRRTGATMLVDDSGRLSGIFTDSDLARLFEQRRESLLDSPIRVVMTRSPLCVQQGAMMSEAIDLMARRKISELPVVDAQGRPVGLIDITDVVGLLPKDRPEHQVCPADTACNAASDQEGTSGIMPAVYRIYDEPADGQPA